MYHRILAPIDLAHGERAHTESAHGERAQGELAHGERAPGDMISAILEDVRSLAAADAQTTLLYVMPKAPNAVVAQLPSGFLEAQMETSRNELARLAKKHGLADALEDVEIGAPQHAILKAAERMQADLIVIGSHRQEFADYLLGSTATHVVRQAPCSVHVVRGAPRPGP